MIVCMIERMSMREKKSAYDTHNKMLHHIPNKKKREFCNNHE